MNDDPINWTREDWAAWQAELDVASAAFRVFLGLRPGDHAIATTEPDYRIALRPYDADRGGGQHPSDWAGDGTEPVSPPLDDIVVNDVALFRMEDMGDYFWMCCYLDDGPRYDRIGFTVRPGRRNKGEPRIVVEACEYPEGDVEYER